MILGDNFLGAGIIPDLTPRHTLAGEQANKAWTIGSLTCALSGSKSKFLSASGMMLD